MSNPLKHVTFKLHTIHEFVCYMKNVLLHAIILSSSSLTLNFVECIVKTLLRSIKMLCGTILDNSHINMNIRIYIIIFYWILSLTHNIVMDWDNVLVVSLNYMKTSFLELNFYCTYITLLSIYLSFCGPSWYNSWMLQKLRRENSNSKWAPNIPLLYYEGPRCWVK